MHPNAARFQLGAGVRYGISQPHLQIEPLVGYSGMWAGPTPTDSDFTAQGHSNSKVQAWVRLAGPDVPLTWSVWSVYQDHPN